MKCYLSQDELKLSDLAGCVIFQLKCCVTSKHTSALGIVWKIISVFSSLLDYSMTCRMKIELFI